jgi:hypothetical protein
MQNVTQLAQDVVQVLDDVAPRAGRLDADDLASDESDWQQELRRQDCCCCVAGSCLCHSVEKHVICCRVVSKSYAAYASHLLEQERVGNGTKTVDE